MLPRPPSSTHFPYTTLFRSSGGSSYRRTDREPGKVYSIEIPARQITGYYERGGMWGSEDEVLVDEQRFGHLKEDRKSTRLNSSHVRISYAVFCLKKKRTLDC